MTVNIPLYTQDLQYPAWLLRRMFKSIVAAGVESFTGLIVAPGSGLQVSIAAGGGFVAQTIASQENSAAQGLYYVVSDTAANPVNTILAPTSNPRVDFVVLRVYDVVEQALTGQSRAQFEWVQGSEVSGANLSNLSGAPTVPDNSLVLANVLQTPGETSISSNNIANVASLALSPYVAALTESGGLNLIGALSAAGITSSNGMNVTGNVVTSGRVSGATLAMSGTSTLSGALAANGGVTTTTLSTSGNASVGGTLAVTGASTLTGAVTAKNGVSTTNLTASGTVAAEAVNVSGNVTAVGFIGNAFAIGGGVTLSFSWNGSVLEFYINSNPIGSIG